MQILFSRSTNIPQSQEQQLLWKLLNLLGVTDPNSGNLLTVHDAIRLKIFDLESATIVVEKGQKPISLEDALKRNLIETQLYDSLIKLHELSKKFNINLRDNDMGDDVEGGPEKRMKVIEFNQNDAKSVAEATQNGFIDTTSGLYKLSNGSFITITEAYKYGYLIQNETVKIKATPLTFSDALSRGLFDENGFMTDRNSGAKFQLHSAIANDLILDNLREIVDTKNDEKISVRRALEVGLLNSHEGIYMNPLSNEKCTFNFAFNSHLISKPATFKDLCDVELMKENNLILSPTFTKWLSIEDAIDCGVLDNNHFKSITKTKGALVTLADALLDGVITFDGNYVDITTGESIPIKTAVERGLISSVTQKSIFDIDGFKDPQDESFMSLNKALEKRILRKDSNNFVLLGSNNRLINLNDGVEHGSVRPEVYTMLMRHIGVFDKEKNELRVIDLVLFKLIDPVSGYLLDAKTGANIPLDTAIERQIITPAGALLLSSLLNITLTTETITKTIKRYVTIRDKGFANGAQSPSFSEAVEKGLINTDEQTYHQQHEQQYYMVQDALNSDRVLADTERLHGANRKATITIVTKSFLPGSVEQQRSTSVSKSNLSSQLSTDSKTSIKYLKKMQKKILTLKDALHVEL